MGKIKINADIKKLADYSKGMNEICELVIDDILHFSSLKAKFEGKMHTTYRILEELQFRGAVQLEPISGRPLISHFDNSGVSFQLSFDKGRFKHIDYSGFGLVDLNYKFNIDDDRFFDGVDIAAFKQWYPKLKVNDFLLHLKDIGFSFTDEQMHNENEMVQNHYSEIDTEIIDVEIEHNIENHLIFNEILGIRDMNTRMADKSTARTKIIDAFIENKYNLFREFCNNESIEYVDQLKDNHISKFCVAPRVGSKKINDVLSRLNSLGYSYNHEKAKFYFSNPFGKIASLAQFSSVAINKFIDFCHEREMEY
ncbi:MAG TPA: hypothetical protein DEA51_01695, partial [Erysipelotrichaceae bacterium]|nr:hypothetical protein [Erysipelotrichaceae bacterium]